MGFLDRIKEKFNDPTTQEMLAKARAAGLAAAEKVVETGKDLGKDLLEQKKMLNEKDEAHKQKILSNYRAAAGAGDDQHLRGSELVHAHGKSAQARLAASLKPGQLQIGGVPIPPEDEQQHFLLAGAPGTGKSVTLRQMLAVIRERGEKAIVYDPVGDMVSQFYRPGIDTILNPLDARDGGWNIWNDVERHEYPSFSKSIVPDPTGQADPFWPAAAQAVLQSLLITQRDLDDLLWLGLAAPVADLEDVIRRAGKIGLVGDPAKTLPNVRATLAAHLDKLAVLHNVPANEAFSLKQWTENDEDKSWAFLLSKKNQLETVKPLISVWLDTVVRTALSMTPNSARRIWLSIDELPSLNKIPSLAPALAEGRKFGLAAILGLQSVGQGRGIYGKEEFSALYGLAKTRLILRISDSETAEDMSKELGEHQVKRTVKSSNTSGGNIMQPGQSSEGTSEQMVIERIVLPSEIAGLPDLHGYLRLGGSSEIAKVSITYTPPIEKQPAHVNVQQRRLPWEME